MTKNREYLLAYINSFVVQMRKDGGNAWYCWGSENQNSLKKNSLSRLILPLLFYLQLVSTHHEEDIGGQEPGGDVDEHGGEVEADEGQQDVDHPQDQYQYQYQYLTRASNMLTIPRNSQIPLQIIQGFIKLTFLWGILLSKFLGCQFLPF